MIDSRTKGKNAELEAALEMQLLLGIPWMRTAQACGKWTGDIVPKDKDIGIHVEVKHYRTGITWWQRRARRSFLNIGGELYYALLSELPRILEQQDLPESSPRSATVEGWFSQAKRDAGEKIPIVLCRQNKGPWLMVWHSAQDDELCEILREVKVASV
jgi:hypothetical protein